MNNVKYVKTTWYTKVYLTLFHDVWSQDRFIKNQFSVTWTGNYYMESDKKDSIISVGLLGLTRYGNYLFVLYITMLCQLQRFYSDKWHDKWSWIVSRKWFRRRRSLTIWRNHPTTRFRMPKHLSWQSEKWSSRDVCHWNFHWCVYCE